MSTIQKRIRQESTRHRLDQSVKSVLCTLNKNNGPEHLPEAPRGLLEPPDNVGPSTRLSDLAEKRPLLFLEFRVRYDPPVPERSQIFNQARDVLP